MSTRARCRSTILCPSLTATASTAPPPPSAAVTTWTSPASPVRAPPPPPPPLSLSHQGRQRSFQFRRGETGTCLHQNPLFYRFRGTRLNVSLQKSKVTIHRLSSLWTQVVHNIPPTKNNNGCPIIFECQMTLTLYIRIKFSSAFLTVWLLAKCNNDAKEITEQ